MILVRLATGPVPRTRGELSVWPGAPTPWLARLAAEPVVVVATEGAIVGVRSARRLAAAAARHGAFAVPRSPSVRGQQFLALVDGDDVVIPRGRARLAARLGRAWGDVVEPIEVVAPLVLAAPGELVAAALARGWTEPEVLVGELVAGQRCLLVYGALAVATAPVTSLVPAQRVEEPLVSACFIVRDEELWIEDAIASLAGFADEVVVYDTGSRDRTLELARRAGALVVAGEWHDDFARARAASAEAAQGRWVLWLDADERLGGDLAAARARLADPIAPWEGYSVRIRNLLGVGLSFSDHFATRLVRRRATTWRGSIHETVWTRDGVRPATSQRVGELYLLHLGYLDAVMRARRKGERNLRVAEHNTSASEPLEVEVQRMRSLLLNGEHDAVLEILRERVLAAPASVLRKLGLLAGFESALALGDLEAAAAIVGALREQPGIPSAFAAAAAARLEAVRGDFAEALAQLDLVTERVEDVDGLVVDPATLVGLRARCLAALERYEEAAMVALEAVRRGVVEVELCELATWLERAAMPVATLGEAVRPEQRQLVAALLLRDPVRGEPILWEFAQAAPQCLEWLAAGSRAAEHLGPRVKERWRTLLEQQGLVA